MEESERHHRGTEPKPWLDWITPHELDFEGELRRQNIAAAIEIYGESVLGEIKEAW